MNSRSVRTEESSAPGTDQALWEAYRAAATESAEKREIRSRLVERYLHLVRFAARRMSVSPPRELEFEDILSFGKIGLLDAIEKYDPSLGFAFSTYAVPRIRGAILDELRRFDWISRSGREKIEAFNEAREEEMNRSGEVSHERVRTRLGASEEEYRQLLRLVASGPGKFPTSGSESASALRKRNIGSCSAWSPRAPWDALMSGSRWKRGKRTRRPFWQMTGPVPRMLSSRRTRASGFTRPWKGSTSGSRI